MSKYLLLCRKIIQAKQECHIFLLFDSFGVVCVMCCCVPLCLQATYPLFNLTCIVEYYGFLVPLRFGNAKTWFRSGIDCSSGIVDKIEIMDLRIKSAECKTTHMQSWGGNLCF